MDYYTGYRLSRFIVAFSVCMASLYFTAYIFLPIAKEYWREAWRYSAYNIGFWKDLGKAVALTLVPFLSAAYWAFYELLAFLDRLRSRR